MSPLEMILRKLPNAKHSSDDWKACCPAHDDRTPSLSIREGDDGRVLLHCFAGCAIDSICEAFGITTADLMPSSSPVKKSDMPAKPPAVELSVKPRIVATYDYHDEEGRLLFQAVRYEPKNFKQRRPNSTGGWEWSVKGTRVVPYRLMELLAEPSKLVFVVEGEKDCENLALIGLQATCNAGGAGKWRREHAAFLHGRHVVVMPDNDKAGRDHAIKVAQSLQGIAASVRILELPGLPEKGDVSDWIEAQPDARDPADIREELERLAEAAPHWMPCSRAEETDVAGSATEPAAEFAPGPVLTCLGDVEAREVSWL